MTIEKPTIIAVVGPTASGKSALAVALAKRLSGEIISCDSMQIYRGMDIGTAKPTEEDMGGIPHHLLDVADAEQSFSCAEYVSLASSCIQDVLSRGRLPILCGGTGLYLDALLRGGFSEENACVPKLRQELLQYAKEHGNHALHERLRAVDAESADAIHENNVRRVVRALEIFESTGIPKSEWDRRSKEAPSPYHAIVIGLSYGDRSILYDRIDRRVDEMIRAGLVEEARTLLARGVFDTNSTAAAAIGYKELFPHLRGEEPLEASIERLKVATRHYAKRQLTWFSAKGYVHWLEMAPDGAVIPMEQALDEAERIIRSH
ncbi:MAG: tRNA (adenosine(37)-N6)-dimethylallyltransferase MiaA [Clostridia bacterium]|nr:tRNA (adenosine(37)-N6)-dimethylallyltransferase MiaA [Clostridia bacterium]